MRQIILINPLYRKEWQYIEDNPEVIAPLGILSIGTCLANTGYTVKIIDACTNPDYIKEIEEALKKSPLFIGLSVMTAQVASALKIAGLVRQNDPGKKIPVIWGGIHPTLFPEDTVYNEMVDVAVSGLGEYTALELSHELSEGRKTEELDNVHGITFYRGKELVKTPEREFIDINELPVINYDLLDIKKYIYRSPGYGMESKRLSLTLYTGVGCPFRCRFCANTALHKRKYSGKTAARILEEVDYFHKKYNIEYFSFCDELFFINRTRINEFLDGMIERNYPINWYANIRADCFRLDFLSEEMVKKMKQAGCNRLGMGVESGSQRILDEVIRKDMKLEHVLEAARLCSKYDISTGYSFMMGLPGEKRTELIETINLMDKLKRMHPQCFFFGPQVYRPFPGSQLHKQVLEMGFKDPQNLADWAELETKKNRKGRLTAGYLWNGYDPAEFPWVKNTGLIRHIDFMQNFLFRDIKSIKLDYKYPLKILLVLIAKFRIKFKFWYFPLEYWIYRFFVRLKEAAYDAL